MKQVMKASEDITLSYHGNTKMVKAVKRYNGKNSIHLLTYSQKGRLRTDLCIYLNEEYNFEDSIGDIYQWIEDIDIGIPTHKKNVRKVYLVPDITFTNHDNLQNGDIHVPIESSMQQK